VVWGLLHPDRLPVGTMGRGAWGVGHGGMGHGAWGIAHRAWGMGHGAWGMAHVLNSQCPMLKASVAKASVAKASVLAELGGKQGCR
jgi:hypothetical protein